MITGVDGHKYLLCKGHRLNFIATAMSTNIFYCSVPNCPVRVLERADKTLTSFNCHSHQPLFTEEQSIILTGQNQHQINDNELKESEGGHGNKADAYSESSSSSDDDGRQQTLTPNKSQIKLAPRPSKSPSKSSSQSASPPKSSQSVSKSSSSQSVSKSSSQSASQEKPRTPVKAPPHMVMNVPIRTPPKSQESVIGSPCQGDTTPSSVHSLKTSKEMRCYTQHRLARRFRHPPPPPVETSSSEDEQEDGKNDDGRDKNDGHDSDEDVSKNVSMDKEKKNKTGSKSSSEESEDEEDNLKSASQLTFQNKSQEIGSTQKSDKNFDTQKMGNLSNESSSKENDSKTKRRHKKKKDSVSKISEVKINYQPKKMSSKVKMMSPTDVRNSQLMSVDDDNCYKSPASEDECDNESIKEQNVSKPSAAVKPNVKRPKVAVSKKIHSEEEESIVPESSPAISNDEEDEETLTNNRSIDKSKVSVSTASSSAFRKLNLSPVDVPTPRTVTPASDYFTPTASVDGDGFKDKKKNRKKMRKDKKDDKNLQTPTIFESISSQNSDLQMEVKDKKKKKKSKKSDAESVDTIKDSATNNDIPDDTIHKLAFGSSTSSQNDGVQPMESTINPVSIECSSAASKDVNKKKEKVSKKEGKKSSKNKLDEIVSKLASNKKAVEKVSKKKSRFDESSSPIRRDVSDEKKKMDTDSSSEEELPSIVTPPPNVSKIIPNVSKTVPNVPKVSKTSQVKVLNDSNDSSSEEELPEDVSTPSIVKLAPIQTQSVPQFLSNLKEKIQRKMDPKNDSSSSEDGDDGDKLPRLSQSFSQSEMSKANELIDHYRSSGVSRGSLSSASSSLASKLKSQSEVSKSGHQKPKKGEIVVDNSSVSSSASPSKKRKKSKDGEKMKKKIPKIVSESGKRVFSKLDLIDR